MGEGSTKKKDKESPGKESESLSGSEGLDEIRWGNVGLRHENSTRERSRGEPWAKMCKDGRQGVKRGKNNHGCACL